MQLEYDSLLTKGAIAEVQDTQVQKLIEEGRDVEILPGRGVPSEKPPLSVGQQPRKKYRAAICGNFQRQTEERASESFYVGGADSISILRWGGLHGYGASGVDIKTAFLNAPKDEKEPEYLLCNPPKQMVAAGVGPKQVKWRVLGALYGLVSSPRSWSVYRDKAMRGFRWSYRGADRLMQPCLSDPNIWKVLDPQTKQLQALVAGYVDDILIIGVMGRHFWNILDPVWDCSSPEHSENGLVTFCGLEISSKDGDIRITQEKYVLELLKRHALVEGCSSSPCAGWKESYDDAERKDEVVDQTAVRMAQSLTGELLWLAVRARPEIAFPVARMSQLCVRRPQEAVDIERIGVRTTSQLHWPVGAVPASGA